MTDALVIKDLHKTYKGGFTALKGISLTVKEGDFFALLGPNGAGKSTTIGIISSLVNKTSGKIEVFGVDIDDDWAGAKRQIGIVPQEFNFSIFEKVKNIVRNQAGYYGIPRALAKARTDYYLNEVGLYDKRNEIAQRLSGGMKRRLMIARALIHEPKLLILDEPTAGVDIEVRRTMWDFLQKINEQGTSIILTTHYLEEAENNCKRIAIIDHGEIVEDTTMRELLLKLNKQSFILELSKPLDSAPISNGLAYKYIDRNTLEVEVSSDVSMNHLFKSLNDSQVEVASMRNKSNRLEELFLHLTGPQDGEEI